MVHLEIKSIEFIEHYRPNMSCGTGYSEPDIFEIEFSDGTKHKFYVDIWYRPRNCIRGIFEKELKYQFKQFIFDNVYDGYKMYLESLKDYYGWSVEEMLNLC